MPSQNRRLSFILLLVAAGASERAWADQQSGPGPVTAPPAEELRLSTALFREGLKQRGLTALLELHVKDFPPASPTAVLLMTREVKLAAFADATRSVGERRAAIAQANRILERLIEDNPDDARRLEWLYTLGNSLLYDEGQPYSTNILYTGGNDEDRHKLSGLTSRAVAAARSLVDRLADEYERIDGLSIEEFERIEGTGYLDKLDRIGPNADYLLAWALFYDCLPRPQNDPALARLLNEILLTLSTQPAILETPHTQSNVQIPALLLAGMTHRRLNDHHAAREFLDRARRIADRLGDPAVQESVRWAVTLADVESVRNDRDSRRWGSAAGTIERLRRQAVEHGTAGAVDEFGVRLVAALLERSLYQVRATEAEEAGRLSEAVEHRNRAWHALAELAAEEGERREELYATLYRSIGPDADPEQLDPIAQAAFMAGLLSAADSAGDGGDELIGRAVATGERFLANLDQSTRSLAPEMLRQLGAACYRRGDVAGAADRFLEIAEDYPSAANSFEAATIAVQLAAELYAGPEGRERPEVRQRYSNALRVLLAGFTNTDAARYWRFFYAQLLEESGDYDAAAVEYALIDATHEQYLDSAFLRLRCLARALEQHAAEKTTDGAVDLMVRADNIHNVHRDLVARAAAEAARCSDADRASAIRLLLAKGRLLTAEIAILPQLGRYSQALESLADFEEEFSGLQTLSGRLWRVRLLAFEALGQLDDATEVIPSYVRADPGGAGRTLQSLYDATAADAEESRAQGKESAAQRKAETALVLAKQLDLWANAPSSVALPSDRRALTIQLAEANLRAGRDADALELFERSLPADDGISLPETFLDLRALYGHAESLMHRGDFDQALPTFNRLATGLAVSMEIRWKSLLADLRCRTALGHPPEGIIKVIEQQKYLYPEMGGLYLSACFDRLLRENERRLAEE